MFNIPASKRFRLSARNRAHLPVQPIEAKRDRIRIADLKNVIIQALKTAICGILITLMRLPMLTLIIGPKLLLTSRISGKCAALMLMLCTPSLLLCSILTIPAILFQSPQQHAYFYFSKLINEDPNRWIVLLLAGLCSVLALAIPATTSEARAMANR